MSTRAHCTGLIFAAVLLLSLSLSMPSITAAPPVSHPSPEVWPAGRTPDRFADLAARAPGSAAGLPAPAAGVSSVPDWERVAFQSLRDGNWDIYLAYGTTQLRLTDNYGSDVYPSLNRGATRIAYAGWIGDSYEIYAMNADGSGGTRLTYNDKDDTSPAWSPDGSRIAFASYRDGQSEIYVMNADGSNQVRLTANGIWDGEPAWSPDGTQIAFSSYRDSLYRIWRMNADGSNQVQLSDQAYSENATWSSTGQIAFDADGNGDGWQELWVMNADGSGEMQAYDPPESDTDARAGSWSPDGRYVVLFRVSWIYYYGNWYWTTSYLDAWDSQTGAIERLSSEGEDMYPDWQTADLWPPVSSVSPLRPGSPSPFTVSWSGYDEGPAGLAGYDVQVRDGAGGWTDWLLATPATSAGYSGVGGHTYYFRCRARDNAGNVEDWPSEADAWTTIEALPPITAVQALPAYSRGEITVRWQGRDAGGSGIASYDVQYRDESGGGWVNWQMGTSEREAPFSGDTGHTYGFRSRGIDVAQNVEAWPPGDGDASTTVYAWAISGTLRDNRETPVMGGLVSLEPPALLVLPGDVDGAYLAYEGTPAGSYLAEWHKAGYQALPTTEFDGSSDAQADMVLPPADNAVQNWGFETGSLEPEWEAGGEFLPGTTPNWPHSGGYAAEVGHEGELFEPWTVISNTPGQSQTPLMELDSGGVLHAVWRERTAGGSETDIFYARREPGGDWSEPVNVSVGQEPWYSWYPQLAVQPDGLVHVAWAGSGSAGWQLYYSNRSLDGTWSGPAYLADMGDMAVPDMALGPDAAVHLVWETSGLPEILYIRRASDGTWSPVANVSQSDGWSVHPQVAAGPDGTAHAVWRDDGGWHDIFYAWRASDGTWSAPLNISNTPNWTDHPTLEAGADGSLHVTWVDNPNGRLAIGYVRRSPNGTWSNAVNVSGPFDWYNGHELALGADGSVHLVWIALDDLYYARRDAAGVWSMPELAGSCSDPNLRIDSAGMAHIACVAGDALYARRTASGAWSGWTNISNSAAVSAAPSLVIDTDDAAHVVWEEGDAMWEIAYAGPAHAEETGRSLLSQRVAVPTEAAEPTLSFWYRLQGTPAPGVSWFEAQVDDGEVATGVFTAAVFCNWTYAWLDLAPWAGQTVSLTFVVSQTAGMQAAWAYLDEVSLGSAFADVWVTQATGSAFVLPGRPVELILRYGNRGGVAAAQVVLTDTLPPGLQFITADPPPTTITPTLTWAAGDLAPGGDSFTITLTLAPEPDLPPGTTVTNTVDIGSASAELETLNNRAAARVWYGWRTLLPVVAREY